MGRRPKQTFLQTRHTNGQQATEKMLNIANYQRNSNQTCNEVRKTNNTIKQMGGRPKQTFLQRRHTDGQQIHVRMFNIIYYQRNANQNYNEIPPHTGQNGANAREGVHCWRECKLLQPLLRTVWRFLRKLKIELPYEPAITLFCIYPEKTII